METNKKDKLISYKERKEFSEKETFEKALKARKNRLKNEGYIG